MALKPNGSQPLVSIGIPTYNRSKSLIRALESALRQDYQNIEIIISDNASSDNTEELCQRYASKYPNIKYSRFPENLGPHENFKQVLKASSGDYFMWLADDDFIDENYVSECLCMLRENDDVVIAGGRATFLSDGVVTGVGKRFNIISESPLIRIIRYLWGVYDNSIYYGLYRRCVTDPDAMVNCLAGDWFYIAGILVNGKALTSDNTHIYRNVGGASISYESMIRILKLPSVNRWFPGTMIGITAVKEVLFNNKNYKTLSFAERVVLSSVLFCLFILVTGLYGNMRRLRYKLMTELLGMRNYNKLKGNYNALKKFTFTRFSLNV